MKTVLRLVLLCLAVVLIVSLTTAQEDYKILRARNGTDDTPGLDPSTATDASSIQVLLLTSPGLTTLAEADGSTLPGIASSWDMVQNDDGTATYTFHLIEGIPWVRYDTEAGAVAEVTDDAGNVRYVNANDVYYGMMRTINPATGGDYAAALYSQIVGGTEYYSGTGAAEDVGIVVVDDYTIQITSPFFAAFQTAVYGLWMARPEPQWAIEEYAEFWTEAGNNQSYGPYVLKEWVHNSYMTLVKNPFWPGIEYVPVPAIDEIQFYFVDETVGMAMYEAGELDFLDNVAAADIDRVRADSVLSQEFTITSGSCNGYYGFNVTLPPVDNVHMRRALSYAMDREALIDNVLKAGQTPAQWFTMPGMLAAPIPEDNPDLGIWYDPDLAREEFQLYMDEMGFTSVDQIPALTLLTNAGSTNVDIAEAAQEMWSRELGFNIEITQLEFAVYLNERYNSPLWRAGWCMDFPDTHNWLYEVFFSTSGNNHTHWASAEFDALVDQAMRESDTEVRRGLYTQAEELLVYTDAAIIPLWFGVDLDMIKPYVENTEAVDNSEYFFNWDMTAH
jgi:oligopeptide transport system substrate-binding protein